MGTGFVVEHDRRYFGVTNRHVARDSGASVIRLNRKNGQADILDHDPMDWETIAGGHDIAALRLDLDSAMHQVSAISSSSFLPDNGQHEIGVGDDVFMIGLFVNHEGKEKNNPLARFGNISMMAAPDSEIHFGGHSYESFIVDMHSRSGFSGSPVFVYRTFGGDLENPSYGNTVSMPAINIARGIERKGGFLQEDLYSLDGAGRRIELKIEAKVVLYLLGIHWMQFPEPWKLESMNDPYVESNESIPNMESKYVKGMSGMTGVAPAWKIMEVINAIKAKTMSN